MKKRPPFLLAGLLTLAFTSYLLYAMGILGWYGNTSVMQWAVFFAVAGCSGAVVSIGYGYIAAIKPWDRGWFVRSAMLLVLIWGTLVAVSFGLQALIQAWPTGHGEVEAGFDSDVLVKGIVVGLILSILVVWMDYSWVAFSRYTQETVGRMRESRNKKELQYRLLRSQLTPHFLFNSLNSASYLVSHQPEQAEEFIRKLASNFTHLLQNESQPLNPLSRELEILDNYMHLMKVRYGEKTVLERRINPEALARQLPALAIQLLVENALKHNVATPEAPLKIVVTADSKQVVVANNITHPPANTHSTGIGLQNLRERYRHYGGFVPSICSSGGFYEVSLPYLSPSYPKT